MVKRRTLWNRTISLLGLLIAGFVISHSSGMQLWVFLTLGTLLAAAFVAGELLQMYAAYKGRLDDSRP